MIRVNSIQNLTLQAGGKSKLDTTLNDELSHGTAKLMMGFSDHDKLPRSQIKVFLDTMSIFKNQYCLFVLVMVLSFRHEMKNLV